MAQSAISEKKIDRHFEVLGKCKHMLGQPKNELNVIVISKYASSVNIHTYMWRTQQNMKTFNQHFKVSR